MEVVSAAEIVMANPSPELNSGASITSSLLSESPATKERTFSSEPSFNLLTLQNHNGQYVFQQPLKTVNNVPAVATNGAGLSKGHIIVRQKPLPTYQQTSVLSGATPLLGDMTTIERIGVKRPLSSSDNNIITKVIITKNHASGRTQAFPVGSHSQVFALTSVPSSGDLTNGITVSQQQVSSSSSQSATTKTVMLTSQSTLPPVKTVIATIPGASAPKFSVPFQKLSTSPTKTPTKLAMIPVTGSIDQQALSSNITVFSCDLNNVSQASAPLNSGSASKVIIKQSSAPTGSSFLTLKGQTLPALAPQSAHIAPNGRAFHLTQSKRTPQVIHSMRVPQVTQTIRVPQVTQTIRVPQVTQSIQTPQMTQRMRVPQLAQNMLPVTVDHSSSLQQIQVPGSRFQYVRLVSPANSTTSAVKTNASDVTQVVQSPLNAVPVNISPLTSTNQVKLTLHFQQQNTTLAPKPAPIPVSVSTQQGVHHIILPVTSSTASIQGNAITSLVPIQPAPPVPVTAVHNQFPSGTTVLSATNNNIQGLQSYALVPASYVTQLQQQMNKSQVTQAASVSPAAPKQARDYVPIASIDPAVTQYTVSRNVPNNNGPTLEATGSRPRKPCNCTKSQCLKLYCDCFANGEFCQNCNCTSCANNLEREEERSKAIKSCLDRNPQAFHPKIGKSKDVEGNRQHSKGCNCKRSGCLKNYCECYEAKIMCTNYCKCVGCKNFEESPERKTLMHLADAAEVRVQQQTAAKTKLSSQISCVPSRPPVTTANGERLPFALITADVAEATSACLLAQAEEADRMKMPPVVQERMIIEEFGRCLTQIIDLANRTRTASALA